MGPLSGIRVIEMAGLAPAPYAGMILADFGADVVRVDRSPATGSAPDPTRDYLARGKRSVGLNMKDPAGVDLLLRMIEKADVIIEPFRPGVMEKLGAGPEVAMARNPRLVYARLTGWGQTGPYGPMAGHDIDYIALSGALGLCGRKGEKPLPPVNLVGDFAGGGMLCALGVVLALFERSRSNKGQVVDAAMVDGAAHLSTFLFGLFHAGFWSTERGINLLDTGAPFYDTYRTKDDGYMAVGAIEPQFYSRLLEGLELEPSSLPHQMDRASWGATRELFAQVFATRSRAQWEAIFDGTDACVAPILGLDEAADHPHNVARSTFIAGVGGSRMPAPAPRLSRTPGSGSPDAPITGADTDSVFGELGVGADAIAELRRRGAIG